LIKRGEEIAKKGGVTSRDKICRMGGNVLQDGARGCTAVGSVGLQRDEKQFEKRGPRKVVRVQLKKTAHLQGGWLPKTQEEPKGF